MGRETLEGLKAHLDRVNLTTHGGSYGPQAPRPIPLLAHTLERPGGLLECDSVLDLGAGIRPFQWYTPNRHICVEASPLYCGILRAHGLEVVQARAEDALRTMTAEGVIMLDVIEHMEREVGEAVIPLLMRAATRQAVVYTPFGFMPQDHDTWGLGEDELQRHRSAWTPDDFPGWRIEVIPLYLRKAFFALWEPSR